jgi:DNA polymerase-1
MPRLVVLDALGLAYRAFYAMIGRPLRTSQGENTSAIYGFGNMVLKLRREQMPDRWALAWDGSGPTFRHEMYSDYKATRTPMPDDLTAQLTPIENLAEALGLPVIEKQGMEADDVMATLAHMGVAAGYDVLLVTGDKDMLQVVGEHVSVLSPQVRGEEYLRIGPAEVRDKWGVGPEHIRDVLALMGDSVDNIPGVPGIGEKTAVELMGRFESLEGLYARLEEITKPALKRRLIEHREAAFLSRKLATVKHDLDLGLTLDQLPVAPIRKDDLLAFARRYEIKRLESIATQRGVEAGEAGAPVASRPAERRGTAAEQRGTGVKLAGEPSPPPVAPVVSRPTQEGMFAPAARATSATSLAVSPLSRAPQGALELFGGSVTTEQLVERIHAVRARSVHGLAVLPLAGGSDPRVAPVIGFAVATRDGTSCYVPMRHAAGPNLKREDVIRWLSPAFADLSVAKLSTDLKRDLHLLGGLGLASSSIDFDVRLASSLCDAEREHDLDPLARDVLGAELPAAVPGGEEAAGLAVEQAAASLEGRAQALFPLADALRAQLEAREQWALFERLEVPLIAVLADMERAGIAIDAPRLVEMSAKAGEEIERLRAELLAMAGADINLESGAQVAKVLFETLGLQPGGRTPSGALSTRSDVLEELAPLHPFPARLLEYRALT